LPATDNASFLSAAKTGPGNHSRACPQSHSFYVTERWLGGTLTNLTTIRKSISRMKFYRDLESNGGMAKMPKQEASALRRENVKLRRNLIGIKDMDKYPGALVVVDVPREDIAIKEAIRLNIPIVALVDTMPIPMELIILSSVMTMPFVPSASFWKHSTMPLSREPSRRLKSGGQS